MSDAAETSPHDQPAANGPNQDALRKQMARAQVELGPLPKAGHPALSRASCGAMVFGLVIAGLAGLFAWGWLEEPVPVAYPGASVSPDEARAAWLGRGFYLRLPEGWEAAGRLCFDGPDGRSLAVEHSTPVGLHMTPRTYGGRPIRQRYTAAAYGRSLRERFKDMTYAGSRYVRVGSFKGAEGWMRRAEGGLLRTFAVVFDNKRSVVELRFRLPGEIGGKAWQEAAAMVGSLAGGQPPPSPPEAPADAQESEDPGEAAAESRADGPP